ncbi:unnamed protein product [Diamesa tonsa]
MCEEHLYGKPINILKFTTDNKLVIDNSALDEIFLHDEVTTRKIAVISIIGAFRKGKSFFLDYCLRFMYANYKSIANPSNELQNKTGWMGPEEQPLQGFSWKSGVKRDTTGIIMWSDVFLHQNEFGEKLAIVLMDTQGLFDNETSPADNSRIFALGTLLSSVQILNLVNIIQEDHLQYLQFATEFARFAAKDNKDDNSKPFQKLLFLIRDFNNPDDFPFGIGGGKNYLKTVLKIEDKQKPELKSVREFINASYETIDCCLMPHPGKTVATSKNNNGCWMPPTAHPVQLLNINENDGEIQFNQKVVNDLFMNPKLSDANVVIFSIVGAFRKGKSFLLNYILRYLYANYESVSNANLINPDNWLGDAKEPLTGFPWKSGTDRDTTGLVLWSDVFLFDKPNGEKIAIYLMDTQGLFGNQTTKSDDSRIFSLSTLISSVQIFNLFNNIQEDQLEFLYLATELAKHASESKINSKSFQNLLILIRDWNNPEEQSCDFDGGNQYLNKLLEVNDHQKPELKFVRNYLRSAFESINCFLMPHPGKTVARDSKYDGNWEHMDEDFLMSMNELLPELLSPNKLKTKVVNGKAIKPAELLIFIKTYIEHFKSGEIPEPQPKYEATLAKICKDVTTNQQAELMNANDLKTEMKIDNNYEGSIDATIGKKSCPVEAIKDDRLLGSQSIEAERAVFTVPHDAHPIDLINFKNETEKLKLNLETLETLFLDDLVADRNAVVISIVGAFRTGKSFLLNYFLRFMYANYRSTRNPNATFNKDENLKNWLEDEHEMLKGFPWKCSKKKGTVCIKFWSDVFLFDDETNGEKIAIYLMDTEGLFEHGSLSADNARILSFSTFISSVQIINLLNIIQENDLKYLKFVTESAKLAGTGNIGKDGDSYQNLMFLIRDWNSLLDYEYGLDGGEKFLENFLKIRDFHITTELESIRQYLKSSFDEINCFLMPYPGKIVARSQSYDGRLSNIDEDFVADRAERAEARMQSDQILQTQAINLLKPSRTHSNCTIA